jgi:type IV secretory pathway VirB3-like protein
LPTEDDLISDYLCLPMCRPTLWFGVPVWHGLALLGFWAIGLVWFGAIITGTGVAVVVYILLRAITAKDFNALTAFTCYGSTKALEQKGAAWSGVTLDPLYGQRPPK